MMNRFGWRGRGLATLLAAALMASAACMGTTPNQRQALSPEEARQIAMDAFIYGYPLVTVEMTRRVLTNVDRPAGHRAPMGQLIPVRTYPDASFRDITAPNADTLYVNGFVDVAEEPWVLSLPDAGDRYYMFPMLDAWTNVIEAPGTRTTGTGSQTYAITGPNWTGSLPAGVTEYKSPTSIVWLAGRIYSAGTPEDYTAVHTMQDQISLMPLSSYGTPYTPPPGTMDTNLDMTTPVRTQVNNLSTEAFFDLLATLMNTNPATDADKPMVDRMARLGIVAGEPFDIDALGAETAAALQSVPTDGVKKIMAPSAGSATDVNGWHFTTDTGRYGTNYAQRAAIAAIGLGANLPEDAVYPMSEVDADGQRYDGANRYVIHFDNGQLPPVNGFWSLTMYDQEFFFVDNPLNRYTISQRDTLTRNPDGSVDVYLQHDNPGSGRQANWLPAPKGAFKLMLRLYWPTNTPPSLIDGSWRPPAVIRAR